MVKFEHIFQIRFFCPAHKHRNNRNSNIWVLCGRTFYRLRRYYNFSDG